MTIIIGIDPGLNHTGWGIIHVNGTNLKFIAAGTISPSTSKPLSERILDISLNLENVINIYKPDQAAIEEVFLNKNAFTSLRLGHARGAIILTIAKLGIVVREYAARLVKKTIVGVGKADKKQVWEMIKILLPNAKIDGYDAADALAVAICHANHKKTYISS